MTTLTSELPGCHCFLYQRREVPGSPAACKTMSSPAVAITSEGHSVRLPDCPVSGNSNHSTMCLKQRQWQIHQGFRMGLRETAENRMRPQGRPRGTRRDVCPPGYQVLHVTEHVRRARRGARVPRHHQSIGNCIAGRCLLTKCICSGIKLISTWQHTDYIYSLTFISPAVSCGFQAYRFRILSLDLSYPHHSTRPPSIMLHVVKNTV